MATHQDETSRRRQESRGTNGEQGTAGQTLETRKERGRSQVDVRSRGSSGRTPGSARGRELGSGLREPFALMNQLTRDMDRLWDSFLGGSFAGGSSLLGRGEDLQTLSGWAPRIDVQRNADELVVRADLPGVRKEDIELDVNEDGLVISGERREEREAGGGDESYYFAERSYGRFYRTIPLPSGVNPEDVRANMRDGVLEVTIPLPQSARRRRIEIQE